MKRTILLAALMSAATYFAFGQVKSDKPAGEDARPAIEAKHGKFIGAVLKRDAATVAALYAADAKVLPQNGEPVEGPQNIQAFWQGVLGMGARLVQLETTHVEARDDLAYEVGKYTMTTQSAPGQTDVHTGNYAVVWRRQDGEWKVAANIWNSSKPAPARQQE